MRKAFVFFVTAVALAVVFAVQMDAFRTMATRNIDRDRRECGRCTTAAEALHQERAVRGDPSCDVVALRVR